jgi:hypothetical protein
MPSRRFFTVWNRTTNPVVKTLLRSPAHRLVSGSLALITVTGRRSGREYTFPVNYTREGDRVRIAVGWPESKVWWRNLTGEGAPVDIVLAGERLHGHAVASGDESSGVSVEVQLA